MTDPRAEERLRCVMCEACGGTGEIIRRNPVGPYEEPDEYAELCSACGGYGRDYEDDPGDEESRPALGGKSETAG